MVRMDLPHKKETQIYCILLKEQKRISSTNIKYKIKSKQLLIALTTRAVPNRFTFHGYYCYFVASNMQFPVASIIYILIYLIGIVYHIFKHSECFTNILQNPFKSKTFHHASVFWVNKTKHIHMDMKNGKTLISVVTGIMKKST